MNGILTDSDNNRKDIYIVKKRIIKITLIILLIEKIIQHFYTALAFLVYTPTLGIIDLSPYMGLDRYTLAFFNFILMSLLIISVFLLKNKSRRFFSIVLGVAIFDIIAEFIFHGFIFITISVVISTIILVILPKYKKIVLLS